MEITEALERQEKRLERIESLLSTQKEILNLHEASEFTGLSKSHLYKLTSAGKIKHFKQSKHLYFDKDEVVSFLKENRVKTSQELQDEAAKQVMKGGKK